MKILLLFILLAVYPAVSAQELAQPLSGKERRAQRHDLGHKENTIFVTLATGYGNHNQILGSCKIEYSRQIKGNFYWGGVLSANIGHVRLMTFDIAPGGPDPYRNTVDQNIYKLDAMVYYRAPVIRSRLFFRLGTGLGLGYHHITEVRRDGLDDRVLPYVNVEAAWILRCSRDFEMKFSPTIFLLPSQVAISPVRLGPPTDVTPVMLDYGFSLTCGWRF